MVSVVAEVFESLLGAATVRSTAAVADRVSISPVYKPRLQTQTLQVGVVNSSFVGTKVHKEEEVVRNIFPDQLNVLWDILEAEDQPVLRSRTDILGIADGETRWGSTATRVVVVVPESCGIVEVCMAEVGEE
jgi:hypothetical protein